MDWLQVLTIIGANFALILPLWLWNRSESRSDSRELHSIMREMKDEMKDFHGRMVKLEERYLKLREDK